MTVHFTETNVAAIINSHISDEISELSKTAAREDIQIVVTGHSLGGAYAQIMGAYLMNDTSYNDVNIEVYTFGSPQVFQRAEQMPWAVRMQNNAHHFVVSKDPVPKWQTCRTSSAFGQGMKLFKAYKKRDTEDLVDTLVTTSLSYLQAQLGHEENILDYQQFGTFWITEE
jgi:predicted lipase